MLKVPPFSAKPPATPGPPTSPPVQATGSGTSVTERETVAWADAWPSDTRNTKLSAPKKFGWGV